MKGSTYSGQFLHVSNRFRSLFFGAFSYSVHNTWNSSRNRLLLRQFGRQRNVSIRMCYMSFGAAQLTFWIVFGACLAEGSRERRHVGHLLLGIDSYRRHLLGLRRACLRDVSQWVWLRRQHGDQVSRLANQISPTPLLHAFLFTIAKFFLPQRTKVDSLDGTEAGCTLSNYFKGLAEELSPINQGFSHRSCHFYPSLRRDGQNRLLGGWRPARGC